MTRRSYTKEVAAILPWAGAALLWFGLVTPIRATEASNLAEQSRIRRDRLEASRQSREAESLLARVKTALAPACRSSTDAAALRQRTIAVTVGLRLSPLSLSVAGPPAPGAMIEAEGTRAGLLELAGRLGDPRAGGFLRSVSIRDLGGRSAISALTAPFELRSRGPIGPLSECGPLVAASVLETTPRPEPPRFRPRPLSPRPATAGPSPVETPVLLQPVIPTPPPPPFSLVAFLRTDGQPRLSVRSGDQILVVSVGDQVEGWKCVSIDRDEGAIFEGAAGRRVVLKANPGR